MVVVLGTSFDDTKELTDDSVRLETVFVVVVVVVVDEVVNYF